MYPPQNCVTSFSRAQASRKAGSKLSCLSRARRIYVGSFPVGSRRTTGKRIYRPDPSYIYICTPYRREAVFVCGNPISRFSKGTRFFFTRPRSLSPISSLQFGAVFSKARASLRYRPGELYNNVTVDVIMEVTRARWCTPHRGPYCIRESSTRRPFIHSDSGILSNLRGERARSPRRISLVYSGLTSLYITEQRDCSGELQIAGPSKSARLANPIMYFGFTKDTGVPAQHRSGN